VSWSYSVGERPDYLGFSGAVIGLVCWGEKRSRYVLLLLVCMSGFFWVGWLLQARSKIVPDSGTGTDSAAEESVSLYFASFLSNHARTIEDGVRIQASQANAHEATQG